MTGCQHEPTGSRRGRQRPVRGQGPTSSLTNVNPAKICSFPKLTERYFPNVFVSSSVLVNFKLIWLDKALRQLQRTSASQTSCLTTQLCSSPSCRTEKTTALTGPPLLSLAGAAGDKGLPRLRPRRDRAAGGSIHHVHTPGGTWHFYKEETEEGKSFNRCVNAADRWIWEDLTPIVSDRALLEDSSNHYL